MKKKAAIMTAVLILFLIPAAFLNGMRGVEVYGEFFVLKEHGDGLWSYSGADNSVWIQESESGAACEVLYSGQRYLAQLTWNGNEARIEFDDGEVIEGTWMLGELNGENGLPLWWKDEGEEIVFVTTGEEADWEISRYRLACELCRMERKQTEAFGSFMLVFLGVIGYILGMLCVLLPEKMYFLGGKWKYAYAELSDMGRTAQIIGGYATMAAGVLMMYLCFFVRVLL